LLDKGHDDFALDFANRAQLLSDDKKAFHDLDWMKALTAEGSSMGPITKRARLVPGDANLFRPGGSGAGIQGMERKAEGGHPPGCGCWRSMRQMRSSPNRMPM